MIHKHCFHALDKSLRDVLKTSNPNSLQQPFGGKVVVLRGDFRQILPVVPKGSRHDIVNAAIKSSYLWNHCEILKLTVNMRLQMGFSESNNDQVRKFAEWMLNVGEGKISLPNDGVAQIEIPDDYLIHYSGNPLYAIVNCIYPSISTNIGDLQYLRQGQFLPLLMIMLML